MMTLWRTVRRGGHVRSPLHTSALAHKEPSKHKEPQPQKNDKKGPTPPSSVADRDREIRERLCEREGGHHAVGIVNGRYEGGLGEETRKNMFRLI